MIVVATAEQHLPDLIELWNEPDVMRWVGFPDGLGMTPAGATAWFDAVTSDPSRHHFVVMADDVFCGEVYYRVDTPAVTAGLDVKLLPTARGRGLATAALITVIEWVFTRELSVEAVWTEPSDGNAAAQRLYTRCGLVPAQRPAPLPPGPSDWERRRSP